MSAEQKDHFAFVLNIGEMDAESFELADGHTLRRATRLEMEGIRSTLYRLSQSTHVDNGLWEGEWAGPSDGTIQPLPAHQWRYFVITFQGSNDVLLDLEHACDLTLELEIGFTELGGGKGHVRHYSPYRVFQVLQRAGYGS